MNSHQRRKHRRQITKAKGPTFIRHWEDLAKVPESETHRLKIDVEWCNGWIERKDGTHRFGEYLSTHTFYGSSFLRSTKMLRECGFNVTLANWDAPGGTPQPFIPCSYP
jgi:hypothetical protein